MGVWNAYGVGVCYYPEHWKKELWADDLCRMLANGIGTVRIGEFAWNLVEKSEGVFDYAFFDEFLDLCLEKGMKVIFGTPTATPPAWLTEKYPEVLNGREDGALFRHGGRRHYNYNSPVYLEKCRIIVEKEAERWGRHPAIVGWQTYTAWEEIHGPRLNAIGAQNPSLELDYRRFISESAIAFAALQAEILRRYIPEGVFITTNGIFGNLDSHRLTDTCLDVMCYDSYPNFAYGLDQAGKPWLDSQMHDRQWSLHLSEVRSISRHFGIMEQQAGAGGWYNRMEAPMPRPGQLGLWALQSVAHGADFVSFFRWRTSPIGTEIYWHGILDWDSRDNRRLREVHIFSENLKKLSPVFDSEIERCAGLLQDFDNQLDAAFDRWHDRAISVSRPGVFAACQHAHVPMDVVQLREKTRVEELLSYRVLFLPHAVILGEEAVELLHRYVTLGGPLVVGARTGYKDIEGSCPMAPMPGLLRVLTGTTVTESSFVAPDDMAKGREPVVDTGSGKLTFPVLFETLAAEEGTEVLGRYANGPFAGEAAICRKAVGDGCVIHVGGVLTEETARYLMNALNLSEPFADLFDLPETVEAVKRTRDGKDWYFLLNYLPEEAPVTFRRPFRELLSEKTVEGQVKMAPYGVMVLTDE